MRYVDPPSGRIMGGTLGVLRNDLRCSNARVMIGRLESVIYRLIIVPLVAFLPAPFPYGFAVLVGDLRYKLYKPFRKEIEYALEQVFGSQLSFEERSRIARDWFRLRSCEAIDMMRLVGNGRALTRLVKTRGLEHVEAALAAGRGAILCSAHFGSYRCCFSVLGALGFPAALITNWSYDDDRLSPVDRLFSRLIRSLPVTHHLRRPNIVRREGKIGVAIEASIVLRENELIATMLDHSDYGDPVAPKDRTRPVPMKFLNREALMLPWIITIAQLMDAPMLMTFMRRSADWRHQVLEISPPISLEGDAETAFQRCLATVEAAIRRNPAHWEKWNVNALVQLGMLSAEDRFQRSGESN